MFHLDSRLRIGLVAPLGVLVTIALTGCGSGSPSLSFQGTRPGSFAAVRGAGGLMSSSNVSVPVYATSGAQVGTLTLTDVRVALKEIKIKTGNESDDDDNSGNDDDTIKYRGPYVVNLLTNSVTPSLPEVNLAAGTYRQIQMKLDKIEGDEVDDAGNPLVPETDPLFGNSVYVQGTYTGTTASGTVTDMPFAFSYDLDETFDLTGLNDTSEGFVIGEKATQNIIVAFRLKKWFAFHDDEVNDNGYEFANIVVQSGSLALNKHSGGVNAQLRQVIRDLIKSSADYGLDDDDDGVLDDSEDDDPDSEDSNDD